MGRWEELGMHLNGGEVSRDMSRVMRGIYTVNGKMRTQHNDWSDSIPTRRYGLTW